MLCVGVLPDAGKLMAVIEAKREQVGKIETVKEMLRVSSDTHTHRQRGGTLLRERMLSVSRADVNITAAKLFYFLPQNVHLSSR